MKCQIIRHQNYSRGSIANIGRENHREAGSLYAHKNKNIDTERTHLNINIMEEKTLYKAWEKKLEKLGIEKPKHKTGNLSQLMITASPEWFEEKGWDKQKAKEWATWRDCPKEILDYFKDSLELAKKWIGEENVISITLHLDEENPHLHISFLSIHEGLKRKNIWARDENGKLIRGENGEKIRARDEQGNIIYEYVETGKTLSVDSFMRERGGANSYRKLQDLFFEEVGKKHGLNRGNIGSKQRHRNHHEYSKIIEQNALIINEQERELEDLHTKTELAEAVLKTMTDKNYIKVLQEANEAYKTLQEIIKITEHYKTALEHIQIYGKKKDQKLTNYVEAIFNTQPEVHKQQPYEPSR